MLHENMISPAVRFIFIRLNNEVIDKINGKFIQVLQGIQKKKTEESGVIVVQRDDNFQKQFSFKIVMNSNSYMPLEMRNQGVENISIEKLVEKVFSVQSLLWKNLYLNEFNSQFDETNVVKKVMAATVEYNLGCLYMLLGKDYSYKRAPLRYFHAMRKRLKNVDNFSVFRQLLFSASNILELVFLSHYNMSDLKDDEEAMVNQDFAKRRKTVVTNCIEHNSQTATLRKLFEDVIMKGPDGFFFIMVIIAPFNITIADIPLKMADIAKREMKKFTPKLIGLSGGVNIFCLPSEPYDFFKKILEARGHVVNLVQMTDWLKEKPAETSIMNTMDRALVLGQMESMTSTQIGTYFRSSLECLDFKLSLDEEAKSVRLFRDRLNSSLATSKIINEHPKS